MTGAADYSAPSQLRGDELLHTFCQVDSLLLKFQGLWRIQPINCVSAMDATDPHQTLPSILHKALPDDPATVTCLVEAIAGLSLQQIEHIDASSAAQDEFFTPLLPQALAVNWLIEPASDGPQSPPELLATPTFPFWMTNGIGGRKLGQIKAFIAHIPAVTGSVVEWCAGKGHLGRLLSYANQASHHVPQTSVADAGPPPLHIISLEWQSSLCASGALLAQQFDLAQTFQQTDVLSGAGRKALAECDHAIALHACGDLHRTLLEQATQAQLKSVWLAPCCYHLTAQATYRPMSQAAGESGLSLSRAELKLAVQGQVTAGERVRTLRQTEVTWRLTYQLMRERYAHANAYRALPSVAKQWFCGRFEDFADWACAQHDWALPQHVDWQMLLSEAEQRYLLLKRLDLIRHVFRRPLELWLALDRALFLLEQDYEVSLQAFCDYQMTPRNLLICAQQRGSSSS